MEREKQNYRLIFKWAAMPLPTWLNNLVLCAWRNEAFALQVNSWLNRWKKRPGAVSQGSHAHNNHRYTWGEEGHNRKYAHQLRRTEKVTSAWFTTLVGTQAWSSTLHEILLVRGKGRCYSVWAEEDGIIPQILFNDSSAMSLYYSLLIWNTN